MAPEFILMLLVFLATMGVVLAAHHYASRSQRSLEQRMRAVVEGAVNTPGAAADHRSGGYLPTVTAGLKHTSYFQNVENKLVAAGIPLRAGEFVAICVLVGAASFLTGAVWSQKLTSAAIGGAAGFFAPNIALNMLAERRRQALESQLADTLVMISSALQGGFSFLQGIQMAAEQMPQPIAAELQRIVRRVQLGMPLEEALWQMGERVQSYDYDLMIAATNLQLSTGGNLVGLFKTITETIQERLLIRGEIQATTAQGRLSAVVLVLLPVGMMGILTLIKPGYAHSMLFTPVGVLLLQSAAVLQLLGIVVIRRMLNLDLT